nr:hypothetical protein [Tanacetum cinerariifolium]
SSPTFPRLCTRARAPPSQDYVPGPEHPPSPIEIPYVPEPEYPKYLAPSDDEAPLEDQPLPTDASPTAASPGYMTDSNPEEEEEPFEENDEEEEEHPAPADSPVLPTVDFAPSAKEAEALELGEPIQAPGSPISIPFSLTRLPYYSRTRDWGEFCSRCCKEFSHSSTCQDLRDTGCCTNYTDYITTDLVDYGTWTYRGTRG